MGQPMAPTAGFFRDGAAAVASGGAWPAAPHGMVPANPAWTAHASTAFARVAAGGSHPVGQPTPPPQSLPPSGPPSTPPAGPSATPTGRVRNRHRTRASTARPRSASPNPSGAGGPARAGLAAPSDGEEEVELKVAGVLTAVKRSFATVRGVITEQHATTNDLGRQVAAGMTKIDRLAVAVEQIANSRRDDHALMTRLEKKIDDLIERLQADGGDGETSEAAEDPHAWVGVVRKNMLIKLKQDFIDARTPWEAYKTTGEHNLLLTPAHPCAQPRTARLRGRPVRFLLVLVEPLRSAVTMMTASTTATLRRPSETGCSSSSIERGLCWRRWGTLAVSALACCTVVAA